LEGQFPHVAVDPPHLDPGLLRGRIRFTQEIIREVEPGDVEPLPRQFNGMAAPAARHVQDSRSRLETQEPLDGIDFGGGARLAEQGSVHTEEHLVKIFCPPFCSRIRHRWSFPKVGNSRHYRAEALACEWMYSPASRTRPG